MRLMVKAAGDRTIVVGSTGCMYVANTTYYSTPWAIPWMHTQLGSSGSAATVATLLEPITAAAVAAVLLDERIGPLGLLGTALVLAAVAGLGREDPLAQPSGTALVAARARPSPE